MAKRIAGYEPLSATMLGRFVGNGRIPTIESQAIPPATIWRERPNSVELNARNSKIVGSTYPISASSIFKPIGAILTSSIVMSIKATPM
ncbi:hypothetical protein [Rhizobium paranaense]|uniref:hypothetical protein n=1 Tax=Rhizobium paranaense TaxID=1650438 RepID=UPI00160DDF8E|nr:hypothetical protein [Rhizobium paranaense]